MITGETSSTRNGLNGAAICARTSADVSRLTPDNLQHRTDAQLITAILNKQ